MQGERTGDLVKRVREEKSKRLREREGERGRGDRREEKMERRKRV